ncbi:mucin-5AC [Clupea harengus]|uniref:Mucin-5AC n=1 Tax=Clupea harengus TaxID=7950 RepID=A0A6P3VPM7_CLUHA|nr:mucin-5AC [Clupea harengus]
MKPPARSTRSTKSVVEFLESKPDLKTKSNRDSHFKEKWTSRELRKIAVGVRQQFKSRLDDIDTHALQTRVPKRSIQEVESLLEPLKLTVARKVFHQAKKQLKNEREQRVPIQVWTELMERMAGNHEENISSAFTRMLVVAGTEPCSLQHSDPPRSLESPASALTSVRTISEFSTSGTVNSLKSGAQMCSTGDAQPLSGMGCVSNPNISCPDNNNSPLSKPSFSSSTSAAAVVSETFTSATPSPSVAQHTQTPEMMALAQSVGRQTSSSPVGVSSPPPPPPSPSSLHSQRAVDDQGGTSSQGNPSQSGALENTVDFEKIYTYLSSVRKGGHERHLTPMECAVVVDLIMSLPEELPLLDCDNLQEHFLQMYTRLTTPFNPPLTSLAAEPTNLGGETSSITAEPTNLGGETSSRLAAEPTNLGGETSSLPRAEPTNLAGETSSSRIAAEPSNLGGETSSSRIAAEPSNLAGETSSSRIAAEPSNLGGETSSSRIAAEPSNLGGETSSSRIAAEPSNLGGETSSSRIAAEPTNLGGETSSIAAEPSNLGGETASSHIAAEPTNLGGETSSHIAAEPTNLGGEASSSRIAAEPTNLGGEASASGIQTKESTTVPQAPQVKESWENIGICPLNPLMVPISLLARKQDTS